MIALVVQLNHAGLEPELKSKSKPVGGSAMLAAFVKKHAPSEASKAAESSE